MRFIDLFAGIGGFRIPFDEFGYKCVFSSEIDKFARQTYRTHFGEEPHGDITKISAEEIPEHDLLLAGFPCQPFSKAGHQKGFEDSRGTMFFEIMRILKHHKPKYFILENVKQLVKHNNGETLEYILSQLRSLYGDEVYWKVLNAKDFGLPQNRERIFISNFGILESRSKKATKLGDILEDNVDEKYTISEKLWTGLQRRREANKAKGSGFGYRLFSPDSEYVSTITARYGKDGAEVLVRDLLEDNVDESYYYNDSKYYDMLKEKMTNKDSCYQLRRTYVRENKNNLCPTLTANMGTGGHNVPLVLDKINPRKLTPLSPEGSTGSLNPRKLTPRECARLQGFPDSFVIPVSNAQAYKQFGNSVAVNVIRHLAEILEGEEE